jgi:uncharacterized membrane protein YkvA (DUF1232 family)
MASATKTTPWGKIRAGIDRFLRHPATDAVIMLLIVASIVLLLVEAYAGAEGEWLRRIELAGDVFTGIFIVELSLRWLVAPGTRQHFREYWMDWLSVLPFFRPLRTLRVFRVLRALRILRLYRLGALSQRFLAGTGSREFERALRNEIAHYHGRHADRIWLLPDLFHMLTSLLDDGRVDAEARQKICAALAYFITPFEVMPRDIHGPEGYLDQVYLCLRTVQELRGVLPDHVLEAAWEGEGDILEVVEQELAGLQEALGEDALGQIGRYLGVRAEGVRVVEGVVA